MSRLCRLLALAVAGTILVLAGGRHPRAAGSGIEARNERLLLDEAGISRGSPLDCELLFELDGEWIEHEGTEVPVVLLRARLPYPGVHRIYVALEAGSNTYYYLPEWSPEVDYLLFHFERCREYEWPVVYLPPLGGSEPIEIRFWAFLTDADGEEIVASSTLPSTRIPAGGRKRRGRGL